MFSTRHRNARSPRTPEKLSVPILCSRFEGSERLRRRQTHKTNLHRPRLDISGQSMGKSRLPMRRLLAIPTTNPGHHRRSAKPWTLRQAFKFIQTLENNRNHTPEHHPKTSRCSSTKLADQPPDHGGNLLRHSEADTYKHKCR